MRIFNLSPKAKAFVAVFVSLFMATSLQAVSPSSQPPNLDDKATREIPKDLLHCSHEEKASTIDKLSVSTEGCECVANLLTGLLESGNSKEESQALEQAFLDVDLDSICTPEFLLNKSKISEKRNQLNHLLIFLDESEKRLEKIMSDLKWQLLSNVDVDEDFRKGFVRGYDEVMEEKKCPLQEYYRVKKDVVWAYIKLLDFVYAKISDERNNNTDTEIVFESDEDLKEFLAHCDAIENVIKADEEMSLLSEQLKKNSLNSLSIALLRIKEIQTESYNQAYAEIDWHNIYTEAVLSSIEKITEKKKELERICPILDEVEKKWEQDVPDAMRLVILPSCQSNQSREIVEEFIKTVPPFQKQLVSIRKKHALEYLQLLNFLSARYGNYKVGKDEVLFSYEIDSKLCESYLKNIKKLLQEEQDTALQITQQITHFIQKLRERMQHERSSPSTKTALSE